MLLRIAAVIGFVLLISTVNAQRRTWHLYGGPTIGAMYYVGELKKNSLPEEEYLNVSLGLRASMQFKNTINFQLSYTFGGLSGYDSLVNEQLKNRNFQFQTFTHDVEFFTKLTLLNHKKKVTRTTPVLFLPKLLAGFGLMHYNPFVMHGEEKIFLRDLGTEGQTLGVEGYDDPYSKWAFGLKLGGELSFQTGPRTFIDFYGYYTFARTDYLDDVGGGNYINIEDLRAASKSEILKKYAYAKGHQDLDKTPGHTRGNPETNDGYFNFGFSVSYRFSSLGKKGAFFSLPALGNTRF